MYLTKLRLFGFKSFANRVEINFPKDGIISIVGPNGCGKSNIVDAIRWVFGEQKVSALRSTKMEDVIFSGTAQNAPMNMAEVSLIIQNDKGYLPEDHSQIMITRQTYRNGDSAYLINNQQCRLKDINHLFYDTGMGAASYSLMENKMIDSILSDKDEERRVLFEEACGISKYKKQRLETRRQLEKTALNLERVEDSLKHTRQNVNMFERQARKAEKWRDLKNAIRSLELSYESDQYTIARQEQQKLQSEMNNHTHDADAVQTEVNKCETQLAEKKLLLISHENTLSKLNQQVSELESEGVQISNDIQRNRDRSKYLQESIRRKDEDMSAAAQKVSEYGEERRQLLHTLEENKSALVSIQESLDEKYGERQTYQEEYEILRNRAQDISSRRVQEYENFSRVENALVKLKTEQEWLEKQYQEQKTNEQGMADTQAKLELEQAEAEQTKTTLTNSIKTLTCNLQEKEQHFAKIAEALEMQTSACRAKENEKVSLESRHQLLRSLYNSKEGLESGSQYLLDTQKENLEGALFDVITVPEAYVTLTESCISGFLQTLILQQHSHARDLLHVLKNNDKGTAGLYTSEWNSGFTRQRPDISGSPGFVAWLIDEITTEESFSGLLEFTLGHYAVVDNLDTAIALAQNHAGSNFWFVTKDGERVHTCGFIKGGGQEVEKTGLLRTKTELDKTARLLETVTSVLNDLSAQVTLKKEEHQEIGLQLQIQREEIQQAELALRDVNTRLDQVYSSLMDLSTQKEKSSTNHDDLAGKRDQLVAEIATHQEECDKADRTKQALEEEYTGAQDRLVDFEYTKEEFDATLQAQELSRSEMQSKIESVNQRLKFLSDSESEQKHRQSKMDQEGEAWMDEIRQNEEKITSSTETLHELNKQLDEQSKERDAAKEVYDSKTSELEKIGTEIRAINSKYHDATKRAHELELKTTKINSKLSRIRERIFEIYEVDLEDAESKFERVSYNLDTVESEINDFKEQMKRLGSVNVDALENYEDEKKRLEEVQQQFDDLDKARIGLERAIRKLDKVAREQFLEIFAGIQKNFHEVFTTLFEGGNVKLTLEEDADPLDAKIEINASPSGKKMRGVTLLSGGERALTAISLLFALYLVRPSPYCIMDEVDGPLDDANIGRFISLLRRFSDKTQFLIVTHNKRTMAASDLLYGVTQEVKGISQLASVRLDEAVMMDI
ncbi:MAG: chromosome segregation protein SMC [Fibrobacteria bacterium]|nr:chromosome segregation protein SMC [Fibrobacteria bacterium]